MWNALAVIAVAGAVTIVPTVTSAQTAAPRAETKEASHATTGVVKSLGPTSLVITRFGKQRGDMAFEMSDSTHREGTVEVGAPVSVRYREEGKHHVATAVTVQHSKQQAASHTSSSPK